MYNLSTLKLSIISYELERIWLILEKKKRKRYPQKGKIKLKTYRNNSAYDGELPSP